MNSKDQKDEMRDLSPAWPKISLVTPSLNQGKFIEETILSVLEQDYPNLEYFIIDGGSTDDTLSVIKNYETHLTAWINEPDSGQSEAINKGLALATGDIFNWLNADDRYEKGALRRIAEVFMKNPDTEVVCGMEKECFMDDPDREEYFSTTIKKTAEETLYKGHIIQSATFFRMDAVRRMGPLREELHYLMDAEWWMRYLYTSGMEKILMIPDLLTLFRIHGDSKTSTHGVSFGLERRILQASLARSAGVAEEVTAALFPSTDPKRIYFEGLNLNSTLDVKRIQSCFHRDAFTPLYVQGSFAAARRSLLFYLRHGKPRITASLLNYLLRILLLPGFMVKLLRRRHRNKEHGDG